MRPSMACKATVNIGDYSRGGQTRGDNQAADHDMGCQDKHTPFGVVNEDSGSLHLSSLHGMTIRGNHLSELCERMSHAMCPTLGIVLTCKSRPLLTRQSAFSRTREKGRGCGKGSLLSSSWVSRQ